MATQRYTITRGQKAQDVVQAAGGAIATDTVQLNIDFTNMTKLEIDNALQYLRERIRETAWPPS